MYILTEKAREQISESSKLQGLLGATLNKKGWTIWHTNKQNKPNNLLTTVSAIEVIKSETGLKQTEILTKVK